MTRRALARQLDNDNAGEWLVYIAGAGEGGKLWADLDGGCNDVLRMLGARVRFDGTCMIKRVVFIWVVRASGRLSGAAGGGVSSRIEWGGAAVAHSSESSKLCTRYIKTGAGAEWEEDSLLDLPLSPSPTFIGRLQTPHTPRLVFLGTARAC